MIPWLQRVASALWVVLKPAQNRVGPSSSNHHLDPQYPQIKPQSINIQQYHSLTHSLMYSLTLSLTKLCDHPSRPPIGPANTYVESPGQGDNTQHASIIDVRAWDNNIREVLNTTEACAENCSKVDTGGAVERGNAAQYHPGFLSSCCGGVGPCGNVTLQVR